MSYAQLTDEDDSGDDCCEPKLCGVSHAAADDDDRTRCSENVDCSSSNNSCQIIASEPELSRPSVVSSRTVVVAASPDGLLDVIFADNRNVSSCVRRKSNTSVTGDSKAVLIPFECGASNTSESELTNQTNSPVLCDSSLAEGSLRISLKARTVSQNPLTVETSVTSQQRISSFVDTEVVVTSNSDGHVIQVNRCSESTHSSERPRSAMSSSAVAVSLWNLPRRQKLILFCLAIVDFTSQMCLSIMAPFFPTEALDRGVSNTVSGWIFGVFALVQFLTSPIFGKLLPHFGSRFLITAGQFFSGGCVLLFGFLGDMDGDVTLFVIYCFVFRIFLAIGCTASATASFAVTAMIFPDNVATVFGLLETATGLGMMVGPAIGGLLYQAGGFRLPFIVLGGSMIATLPLNYWSLPATDGNGTTGQAVSWLQILRIPSILVVCLCVIMAALLWSVLDPTLAPHLQAFDLSPAVLGLIFLLMSAFYAVFSPIWGWLADRMDNSSPMLMFGFIVSAIGLMLLGPSPWFGFNDTDNYMWLNILALVILGISVSLALVPTFDKILDAVERAGIDDSFAMYSVVSGIWGSCYAFGDFVGPSLGGALVDRVGFNMCMTYIAVGCAVLAVIDLILWQWESQRTVVPPSGECGKLLAAEVSDGSNDQPTCSTSNTTSGLEMTESDGEDTPLLCPRSASEMTFFSSPCNPESSRASPSAAHRIRCMSNPV